MPYVGGSSARQIQNLPDISWHATIPNHCPGYQLTRQIFALGRCECVDNVLLSSELTSIKKALRDIMVA